MLCAVSSDPHDLLRSRVYPAPERPSRTAFQRDRERIVQARAFRRLAGKTQVFTSRASDHFRSRLTHTIEVMQIARSVAEALGLNEDLAETLALVHDIGHPPFGHAGERALDECLKRHGLRFDHNLHALRIVEHFEQRYAAHRGLNLTLGVREGIIKHSRDYSVDQHPELADYFLGQRPPLEAQIIDLADEIAYLTADLDDGVESGLLEIDHIREHVDILARVLRAGGAGTCRGGAEVPVQRGAAVDAECADGRPDRDDAGEHAGDWRDEPGGRARASRAAGYFFRRWRRRSGSRRSAISTTRCTPAMRLSLEHDKAEEVVTALFDFWIDEPEELPPGYFEEIETEGLARVVADYIAGMTDSFILLQYAQIKRVLRR